MKKLLLMKTVLLLCALVAGSSSVWADPVELFRETFGNNTGSARAWSDTYSVKSGVSAVYSGASYTVTEAKQSKNTMGHGTSSSALISTSGKTGIFIVGPLNVSTYNSLSVTNYFGMSSASWSNNSYMRLSYSTDNSTYINVSRTDSNTPSGAVGSNSNYVQASYSLPVAAQSSTLYLKFEFYCYNLNKNSQEIGQAYLDEVRLSGVQASGPVTYSVTYLGNGNTSGSVPVDATAYSSGATVTVLGNTGSLAKTHCTFDGWNTESDGTGTDYAPDATFNITANTSLYAKWTDTRTSAGLAWSATTANVQYGANNNVFPTLTNTHSVPVTYSSGNQAAATIDANGVITLKDYTGSTTISAIFAGNDDYLPQTVTYTLNVTKAAFSVKDGIFDFVEASEQNPIVDYGSGMTLSTSYTTTNKTWTAGNVTMVTSRVSGNGYRWYTDGTLRFYNESKATFSVPSGYVITKIVTTGANFNSANEGTLSGSTWKGASNEVALTATATKNIETITVTYTTANQSITPAKTYTTLTSAYALDFTGVSGLKAFIATEITDSKVQMTQVNKVPANTGLVLKTTTPGSAVNVPVFDGKTPDNVSGNKMVGSATATTAIAENGGYILSNGVFQPATAGTLPAGKAYLNIAVNGARSLEMSFDDENVTAIENIAKTKKNDGQYFNLAGQRVAQPTKGLYIVNGKKVIMK